MALNARRNLRTRASKQPSPCGLTSLSRPVAHSQKNTISTASPSGWPMAFFALATDTSWFLETSAPHLSLERSQ